jgi:hypothetical protein
MRCSKTPALKTKGLRGHDFPSPKNGQSRALEVFMSVVKSVGIFSVGKVLGVLYALLGLIAGRLISLFSLAGGSVSRPDEGINRAVFGVGAIVIVPLLYGASGFIVGIIMAALDNLIA